MPDHVEKTSPSCPKEPEDQKPPSTTGETSRPFKLVKYFSFTGFIVILVFTMALTIFISYQGRRITLKKSDDYSLLLADNLNHQVFLQFVIPTAMRYGRIRTREPHQFQLLDTVVRNTIHSFNVERVTIYDLEGTIMYSTEKELVGESQDPGKPFKDALKGQHSSFMRTEAGKSPLSLDKRSYLVTFYPFRSEQPLRGPVGDVLGIFEIHQDLTAEYIDIFKFQLISIAISLGFSAIIFFILRQIIARGERIIEQRNQERRRLMEKLHHSERLATLGQMIAGVSHEIRNPLGIISSTAEILERKIKVYEPENFLAQVIVEESKRLNGIVTEFLDFARPQIPRHAQFRIEDVLEKNLNYLEPELDKARIEVDRHYEGPDFIEADSDLLYRAFLNIFMNAIQAMPEGGRLSVSTEKLSASNGHEPDRIEVVVADTGDGIPEDIQDKLFNPFFTTKNRGTGLGLAIVKNIVEAQNGDISIQPGDDIGTRLVVRLPVKQVSSPD